jgi:hypothetical protein
VNLIILKEKKRHKQNTPTLKIKIIKTKESKTKQTNKQTQICTYFGIQLWYLHRIGDVMVSMQRL